MSRRLERSETKEVKDCCCCIFIKELRTRKKNAEKANEGKSILLQQMQRNLGKLLGKKTFAS